MFFNSLRKFGFAMMAMTAVLLVGCRAQDTTPQLSADVGGAGSGGTTDSLMVVGGSAGTAGVGGFGGTAGAVAFGPPTADSSPKVVWHPTEVCEQGATLACHLDTTTDVATVPGQMTCKDGHWGDCTPLVR